MLGGEAGVLHPLLVSKISLSKTCQNPGGCNFSQNLEQRERQFLLCFLVVTQGMLLLLLKNQVLNKKEVFHELHYSCLSCSQPDRF